MSLRIGINGFGRIGRNVFKIIEQSPGMDVVAINDLADPSVLANLLRRDTVFGSFDGTVNVREEKLLVNGRPVQISSKQDPENLPWNRNEVQVSVESTGVFRHREDLKKHLEAGSEKVFLSVPPKDELDAMVVLGCNEETLDPDDKLISNASCTTNCLAVLCKVIHDQFGIERGLMTTTHAYTNSQNILDQIHQKDARRARAAAENIIPTSTGAAQAIGDVIPELDGTIDGMAMRVPVPNGSITDLVCELQGDPDISEIDEAYRNAAEDELKGLLEYTEEPLVSSDIVGNSHSCIYDATSTQKVENGMVKLLGWYDNEWGYSNRLVDLIAYAWDQKN